MYEKVLLALDGSKLSAAAIPHALVLAKSLGAEVALLQVIDSVGHIISQYTPAGFEPGPGRVETGIAEQAVDAQRSAAKQYLNEVKERLEAEGVANVSIEVVEGAPGDMICICAKELGCDLVVMGTHGRSGLGRALLGSVADYVVRHTPHAAVLLVRPQE